MKETVYKRRLHIGHITALGLIGLHDIKLHNGGKRWASIASTN